MDAGATGARRGRDRGRSAAVRVRGVVAGVIGPGAMPVGCGADAIVRWLARSTMIQSAMRVSRQPRALGSTLAPCARMLGRERQPGNGGQASGEGRRARGRLSSPRDGVGRRGRGWAAAMNTAVGPSAT